MQLLSCFPRTHCGAIFYKTSKGGGCYGDPHLTTFDGGRYDCQGRGEFVLVEAPGTDTQVQARYEPFTGFSSSVTVTTGVAAREGNSSLVQITNSLDGPVVLVDGEPYDEASGVNNGVALDVSPVKVEINFATSGLIVIASIRSSYLDLSVFAPLSLVTTGLLGNNNGVISDDWKVRRRPGLCVMSFFARRACCYFPQIPLTRT